MATLIAFFARQSRAFDLLMTSSVCVVLQSRAQDAGLENDPDEEQVWHISDVDLSPSELTLMDCTWDGESDTIGAITVGMNHEAFVLCEDVSLAWTCKFFHIDNSERQATFFAIDVVKLILVHSNAIVFSTKRRPLAQGKRRGRGRGHMLALEDGDPGSIGDVRATLPGIADIVAMEEVGDVAWELATRSIAGGDAIDVDVISGFARGCLAGAWRFEHWKQMLAETLCLFPDTGRPQRAN